MASTSASILDSVLGALTRSAGALTLGPDGVATIRRALAGISDPDHFEAAALETLHFACFLAVEREAPTTARAIIATVQSLAPRLVALGAVTPERLDATHVLGLTRAARPSSPRPPATMFGPAVKARMLTPPGRLRP